MAAIGDAKVVMFDYVNNQKVSIPSEIRKMIISLEKVVDVIVDKD
jgi:acyl-CoA thioester hydrolase